MYLSLPVKGSSAQSLTYRLAEEKDLPLLRQLRVECGWGVTKLEKHFENPNWVYVIFVLNEGKENAQDIGMGAWVLDDPSDSEVASRTTRTVNISEFMWAPTMTWLKTHRFSLHPTTTSTWRAWYNSDGYTRARSRGEVLGNEDHARHLRIRRHICAGG
jgi:hypothetical protein